MTFYYNRFGPTTQLGHGPPNNFMETTSGKGAPGFRFQRLQPAPRGHDAWNQQSGSPVNSGQSREAAARPAKQCASFQKIVAQQRQRIGTSSPYPYDQLLHYALNLMPIHLRAVHLDSQLQKYYSSLGGRNQAIIETQIRTFSLGEIINFSYFPNAPTFAAYT